MYFTSFFLSGTWAITSNIAQAFFRNNLALEQNKKCFNHEDSVNWNGLAISLKEYNRHFLKYLEAK